MEVVGNDMRKNRSRRKTKRRCAAGNPENSFLPSFFHCFSFLFSFFFSFFSFLSFFLVSFSDFTSERSRLGIASTSSVARRVIAEGPKDDEGGREELAAPPPPSPLPRTKAKRPSAVEGSSATSE